MMHLLPRSLLRPAVAGLVHRSLKTHFRRICWVGDVPALDPGRPVVACANHHLFHDGYVLWMLGRTFLHRPVLTWMADFDRFPFFEVLGALPFPADDARRRAGTLRRTIREMTTAPATMLTLFPEAHLHPPEEDLLPFDEAVLTRMARLLPRAQWLPLALHATWWGEALPTLLVTAAPPRDTPAGGLADAMLQALSRLRAPHPDVKSVLFEGRKSPQERWSFARPVTAQP